MTVGMANGTYDVEVARHRCDLCRFSPPSQRQDRARIEMDTMAYIENAGALAGASMQVDGDLVLRQTGPLSVYGGKERGAIPSFDFL